MKNPGRIITGHRGRHRAALGMHTKARWVEQTTNMVASLRMMATSVATAWQTLSKD